MCRMGQNAIEYTSKALRQIRRLEDKDSAMIFRACRTLENFPDCANIKKLAQHAYAYRLKVGNFRIFFNFKGIPRIVYVEEVKRRNEQTY